MAEGRRRTIDLRPLRESRDYRLLFCGQLISLVGRQITVVALPYQIYQLTGSALAVGMLGAVQVVPLIAFSLVGGAVADAVDRRRLLLVTNSGLAVCSGLLAAGAVLGSPPLAGLYAVAFVAAGVSAFEQPARGAMTPRLVPAHLLPAALALSFGMFEAAVIAGPAVGGVLIGRFGLATAYLVDVATFAASLTAVALIAAQPPARSHPEPALRAIATGLRFAAAQRAILGGFAIDLNAMIFGLPRALFPVLAATVYHTGPQGLGLLYSAPAAGALVAALLATGLVGRVERQGLLIIASVAVWGLSILGFGVVTSLAAGLALLAVAGAADSVSAVCRSTMMQTLTPDHLRGRTAATFSMVVVGGTYLGDIEAGAVAAATTPRISVISGGAICLVGVGLITAIIPALRHYRARAGAPAGGVALAAVGAAEGDPAG